MLGIRASSNGSPRPPTAGRCHGGTGRENNTQPTSRRNSLCDGLWVSASLDIIRQWDPDVRLSCGVFQSKQSFQQSRKEAPFFLKVTYNKLMAEEIRADGGEEESNVALFNTSDRWDYHLWTTAKVCCFILMRPSSSSFSSQKSPPPFYF